MPGSSSRGPLWMSIVGRSAVVILVTLLGGIAGLIVGGYRAFVAVNALPPAPATMGFESAGFAPVIIFAVHLGLGAILGAGAGLVLGVVGAVAWPRRRKLDADGIGERP